MPARSPVTIFTTGTIRMHSIPVAHDSASLADISLIAVSWILAIHTWAAISYTDGIRGFLTV